MKWPLSRLHRSTACSVSMSALFDDPSCQLSDGWIGARGPTVGPDGARCCRRARGRQGRCAPPKAVAPKTGPSLTATARAGWGCAGRDGRMVRGRTEGCGETSHFRFPRGPWRTREAEAPHASRRAHQFQKWASCRLPQFESCFVLRCPRPSFYARKFNPTDAKTFIAAADTKKAMVKIGDANRS